MLGLCGHACFVNLYPYIPEEFKCFIQVIHDIGLLTPSGKLSASGRASYDTMAGFQHLELRWDHTSERKKFQSRNLSLPAFRCLWLVCSWACFQELSLPHLLKPLTFSPNPKPCPRKPFRHKWEDVSPLLLLWSSRFHKCAHGGLKFYSEITLGSSNYRHDLQAAVAAQTLLEVTEIQEAQFYHSMKAFKPRSPERQCLEDAFNTYLAASLYTPCLK